MNKLQQVIATAAATLRGNYAQNVVKGYQLWSGADIRGRAAKFGGKYRDQRTKASQALYAAGGKVIQIDYNKRVTAVDAGVDDYGNRLMLTTEGMATACKSRWKLI